VPWASWLGCISTSNLDIPAFSPDARRDRKSEIDTLLRGITSQPHGDIDPYLFGLLVLSHVENALQKKDDASYLLRQASRRECRTAGVEFQLNLSGELFKYFFLETYGYRLTALVNLSRVNLSRHSGIITDFATQQRDITSCLRSSENFRLSVGTK
jgi:hypothetical protein